ncbi:MAG TPA: hypothetical protein EYQ24_06120 [Bacteroidetes bacterium]|nr:hypothetical protein [Bacteroidota bacterium]HIL57436.1 hypothetical protein [Rhodothermales bacterium]
MPRFLDPLRRAVPAWGHRLMYGVVRPLAPRIPLRVLDAVGRVLAAGGAVALLAGDRGRIRRYLRLAGRPASGWPLLRHAYAEALARFRHNVAYLVPAPPHRVSERVAAIVGPAVFTTRSTYGQLAPSRWFADRDFRIIRTPYGGEEGPPPEAVEDPAARWRAHQAGVRRRLLSDWQIPPTASPRDYFRTLRSGRSVVLMQDVVDPTGQAPVRTFLGLQRSMAVGAVRIARMAGVPLYHLTTRFEGGTAVVDVVGPLPLDEDALLRRMEDEIRADPASWELWQMVLDAEPPSAMPSRLPASAELAAAA